MAEDTVVGSLHYSLDIDDGNLETQLNDADKKVKGFGDKVGKTGDDIAAGLKTAAKGFAIVGAGLTLVSKQATDFTEDLVKSSKSLGREIGVSTTEASRLTAAFTRMGIDAESASQMFGIFSKNVVASSDNSEANRLAVQKLQLQIDDTKKSIIETTAEIKKHGDKSGELNLKLKALNNTLETQENDLDKSADGFAKLGVDTKDATGAQKDFSTLLFEVADKFKAMPDGIDKTALALSLFGRSGKDIIKVLNLGSDGIQDLEKKADAMGLTLNEKTITAINDLVQSQKDLKEQTDSLKIKIGTETAPVLADFNKKLNEMVAAATNGDGPLQTLTVDVLAFGGPVLAGAAALLSLAANAVQAWGPITVLAGAIFNLSTLSVAAWGAGIVLEFGLVANSANKTTDAINDLQNALSDADISDQFAIQKLQGQATAARASGNQQEANRIANVIRSMTEKTPQAPGGGGGWLGNLVTPSFASGVTDFSGGLARVHAGELLVNMPKGTDVIPKDQANQMGGSKTVVNIGTVNDRSDADYILRRIDRNQQRVNMGISPAMGR